MDATSAPARTTIASRRPPPAVLEAPARLAVAGFFAIAALVMRGVVRAYFRRLVTAGHERFPRTGAVLLVANHPAAWTDAVVLDVALGRKLHFITSERLFHPRMRALLLRMFGSLPVRFGHDEDAAVVNRRTFDRCHELLRRREVVAFFPEGVSGGDRALLPLKPGAARLLIEQAGCERMIPPMIPVTLLYEDRTAFRRDVMVAVGEPIPFESAHAEGGGSDEAARAFTMRIAVALEDTLARASALRDGRPDRTSPAPARRWTDHSLVTSLVFAAGAIGIVLHLVPGLVIEGIVRHRRPQPQQVALGRISLGLIAIVPWYLTLALFAVNVLGVPWYLVFAAPAFGIASCHALDRWRAGRQDAGRADRGEGT